VMDLRGVTTAIVDPREFLAIEGDLASDNILVLDRADDKQKIGLRVAEVTEVSGYVDAQIDTGERVSRIGTSAVEQELVKGVIRKGAIEDEEEDEDVEVELVLWLDIDRLIGAVSAADSEGNQH